MAVVTTDDMLDARRYADALQEIDWRGVPSDSLQLTGIRGKTSDEPVRLTQRVFKMPDGKCTYCGSRAKDDDYGNCSACGAPR